jgi:carboxylate-amine ligase
MDAQRASSTRLPWLRWSRRWSRRLSEKFDQGYDLARYPYEMLDENKFLAARHGLEGTLSTCPTPPACRRPTWSGGLVDRLRPHAEELGSAKDLECIDDLLDRGMAPRGRSSSSKRTTTCARVMREIVEKTSQPD